MSKRRDVLLGAGALGALWLTGAGSRAQAPRKQVLVGSEPATVVDIHAHCIFPEVNERLPEADPAPIILPELLTLGPRRLELMDERGIDIQVLSVNQFWWYERAPELAAQVVDIHDRGLAEWCATHPERFVALSSVALQTPELAAEQLERAVTELGHRGASIGGHVAGEPPTSSRYDVFWARAEALGVPVFMHPNNALNIVRPGGLDGRGALGNIVGNPLETTVFLSHMIFDGVLDRFPALRICAAHGGGYLPSYMGRTEVACEVRNDADCANTKPPSRYFEDQILVDSMVFSDEGLRHLVAETGVSQVVYGSDIPYTWPDTIDLILGSSHLSDADKRAILGGNLIDLLGLEVGLE